MQKTIINPWSWQDRFGFVQANAVENGDTFLFCSGQTAVDEQGNPCHAGDMAAQLRLCLDNLETVLEQAGFHLSQLVQLKYYTTDMAAFSAATHVLAERFAQGECRPASTLLGVNALFHPDILVEIEALAVR